MLATIIADPAVAIPASFGRCVRELDHQLLSWGLAWLASKSTSTPEIFLRWHRSSNDFVSATARTMIAELAKTEKSLPANVRRTTLGY